jgi:hypothetical protein
MSADVVMAMCLSASIAISVEADAGVLDGAMTLG